VTPNSDRRGYQFGSGLVDRSHQQFIVDIPKNASSFILDWTHRSGGWHVHTLTDTHSHDTLQEVIVVLRDPVQRWLSGFAQYACGWVLNASRFFDTKHGPSQDFQRQTGQAFIQQYNWALERLIFDNLETFDDHVWPQTWFLQDLLPEIPRRYFLLDNGFEVAFAGYLGLTAPAADLDRNQGNRNEDARVIQQFLRERIQAVPQLKAAITEAYRHDYELIDCVKCQ
jgi:hypothetical protein